MDLAAEYYMQTIETVFVRHALPKGEMTHRGRPVELKAISKSGLLSVEGEKDDISGVGQTCAANDLCVNIPESRKHYHLAKGVGHYGVFNGSRFRNEIAPRIREFMAATDAGARSAKAPKLNGSRRPKGA
jgi:poly(3-hydroxybutyrate) depolymerase